MYTLCTVFLTFCSTFQLWKPIYPGCTIYAHKQSEMYLGVRWTAPTWATWWDLVTNPAISLVTSPAISRRSQCPPTAPSSLATAVADLQDPPAAATAVHQPPHPEAAMAVHHHPPPAAMTSTSQPGSMISPPSQCQSSLVSSLTLTRVPSKILEVRDSLLNVGR